MFDVVVQGPVNAHLPAIIESYRRPYVNKIIYSGWEDDPLVTLPKDIIYVRSEKSKKPGHGNINLQVISTHAGLSEASTDLVLKTRSDVCIYPDHLDRFHDFYLKHPNTILTPGINTHFALFTIDLVYFGQLEKLKLLYSYPYEDSLNYYPDYHKGLVTETRLMAWYLSHFEDRIKSFREDSATYLHYYGSKYKEALSVGLEIIEKYFTPLPCLSLIWLKQGGQYRTMKQILHPRTTDYFSKDW